MKEREEYIIHHHRPFPIIQKSIRQKIMKFSVASVLAVAALASMGSNAFAPSCSRHVVPRAGPLSVSATEESTSSADTEERKPTKKEKRLQYMKTDTFHRKGFKEVRENVEKSMEEQFKSSLVDELKNNNYVIEKDGVRVHLAKDFGFCWGVERSIALAYEAVEHFPGKKVHITNELIHNPEVNDRLHDMNVQFIEKLDANTKDFSTVGDGDVVILPAFGASFEEMSLLNSKNVDIVDTTCPWVSKVWNTVDQHQRKGLTSIIHGKYAHEETVATTSFCEDYICVKDLKEAEMVADYIVNGGDKEKFMTYFKKATSEGFDPDTMLNKVGLANQTTMYKKETRAIGQLMQKAMMKKFGPVDAKDHYSEFDTICDATQVREDWLYKDLKGTNALTPYRFIISFHSSPGTTRCNPRPSRESRRAQARLHPRRWRLGLIEHRPPSRNTPEGGCAFLPYQHGSLHWCR